MKKLLRKLIPPIIFDLYRTKRRKYGYFGIYDSWEDARKHSVGYDSNIIIEKVKDSALKVKRGEAAYERDSLAFDKIEPSWHLLASLLWIASKNNNSLNILDFGGGLGTSYYQNRGFLGHLNITWSIIEQKKFVDYGKNLFENKHLKFYHSVKEYGNSQKPDVALLSSVMQYLEKPYERLEEIMRTGPKYIIFDKTPFLESGQDIITVQKIPPHIYDASYPSWVFDFDKFVNFCEEHGYVMRTDLNCYSKDIFAINNTPVDWRGFLLESTT